MSGELLSIIIHCRHDSRKGDARVHVVRVDTAEEVQLKSGSYLLRLFPGEGASPERCMIRDLASGRELFVQSGPHLRAFILTHLLKQSDDQEAPDAPVLDEE